jgi:hypothetical protein
MSVAESDYTQDFEDVAESVHESIRSPPLSARKHATDRQLHAPSVSMEVEDHVGSVSISYEIEDHVGSVSHASTPGRGGGSIPVSVRNADRTAHSSLDTSVDRSVVFVSAVRASSGRASSNSGSVKAVSVEIGHVSVADPTEVRAPGPFLNHSAFHQLICCLCSCMSPRRIRQSAS